MALEFVFGFIVSSLLQELVDKIKASAVDTIALAYSCNIEDELKKLEATYVKAQSMLDNVDGWDLISSKLHRDWVADIRRACYETEDFTECLKLEILKKRGDVGFFQSYWSKWGLSSKICNLQSNLMYLISASDQFMARSHGVKDERHLALDKEPMIVPDDESFRRKQDKESIIRLLLQPSSSSVVLIAGMFGVGKTALAQVVKNDSLIQHHFDHRLWVSVSGNFNLMKVLCSMILDLQLEQTKDANSISSPPYSEQQCTRLFQGLCKERRILVVLDDLCNFVKPQDWEDFQSLLLDPSCVFGILITTRNPAVSTIVASLSSITTASYYLQQMSDDDCGLILQKKAVLAAVNKRMRCGRNMSEVIALQIAENFCKGLPLVANIIGYHLSLKQDDQWPIKLSKDLWCMPEFRELIFPAFRLNYSDLSFFLKNCFPYFSLFPKDFIYNKDDLVRLWFAEGYIKPQFAGFQYSDCSEYAVLEELGNYYFDNVLSQSILQIYHPFDQEPQIYRMHEFVHRYAQFIGSDMYIQLDDQFVTRSASHMLTPTPIASRYKNSRHLSLLCRSIPRPIWKDIERYSEGLRTILSLGEHISIGEVSYTLFLKLQSLRVVNLSGTDINELPESVGKLNHLRILDVSRTDIQEFPASITNLYTLQFLKAEQCPLLLQLPKRIKKLTQLLHLEVDIKSLSSMPPEIGNLGNLRTLPAFIVGRKHGYRVTELKNMKYLQGSICLTNLENIKDGEEAKGAMLKNKPFLRSLELEWSRYSANQLVTETVFCGLEPHENLEELQVTGYDGTRFPSWLSSPSCNLTSIHLLRCDQCSILPALGKLQNLKFLHIEEMHCVEYIDDRFSGIGLVGGFPSLESLKLQDMTSLTKWEGLQVTQMPRLRELNITDCPNLISLPSLNLLASLGNLEISYCPALQALPEEGLPLSLETLIIVRSELLMQRCLPRQGVDWEKIKDLRNVVIDFVKIPTLVRLS
ncbi:hypothetical protein BVRB_3g063870 [Beta vulgaris subsp. vulgaris]|nr:hypothetical protein BVRB_3g063870 [Beta vulgaris subsp. vulgaris]